MSTRVLLRAGQRLSMEHLEDRINLSAVAFTSQMSPLTANGVSFDKADVKKADLNGDGDDDFVVSFANARLFVYEKTGPNSFSNRQLIAPSLRRFPLQGQSQLEFDLIDLNSDGVSW